MFEEMSEDDQNYCQFFKEFGSRIKSGIRRNLKSQQQKKLFDLLRYHTSFSTDEMSSLSDYVARMKHAQKYIYYLCGKSFDKLMNSPFMERFRQTELEVLIMTDPVDEFCMEQMNDSCYKGFGFLSITRKKLEFPKDLSEATITDQNTQEYLLLCETMRKTLGKRRIKNVKISNRLVVFPCCIVTSKRGWSSNMERIVKSQIFEIDSLQNGKIVAKKYLEINPHHPIIMSKKERSARNTIMDEITKENRVTLRICSSLFWVRT